MTADYVTLWLPGAPVPKARARVTFRNGRARAYTPEATKAWEQSARMVLGELRRPADLWQGPVRMTLTIVILRPTSCPKRKHPAVRPDGDNYEKAVLDALNGRLFEDDGQVVDLRWTKTYTDDPHAAGVAVEASQICSVAVNEGRSRRSGVISG